MNSTHHNTFLNKKKIKIDLATFLKNENSYLSKYPYVLLQPGRGP